MLKNRYHYSSFEILSWVYLTVSAFLLGRFFTNFLGFNYLNTLFLELIYTLINLAFSLVVFYWIIIGLNKLKLKKMKSHNFLKIYFHKSTLIAVSLWMFLTIGCLFHSTQILFFNVFLHSEFFGKLLILQFSISIFLLIFLAVVVGFIFILHKSKNLEIQISNAYDYPFSEQFYFDDFCIKISSIQKWVYTLVFTFRFYKNLTWKKYFAFLVEFLKLNALKTESLRLIKKQTTPPSFLVQ